MNDIKLIELFFETFYSNLKIKIHLQFDSHRQMDLPHTWNYNIEICNLLAMFYNPENFSPLWKLDDGSMVDLGTIYDNMINFIPLIYDRINVIHMSDDGRINTIVKPLVENNTQNRGIYQYGVQSH